MASRSALLERLALHAPHLSSNPTLPAFMYGTAWKKEATTVLVYNALKNGFRAIDTAAQPKHYREDLVGRGVKQAVKDKVIRRSDVFIQTKYTPVAGQDPRKMPYNPKQSIKQQITQSVESSLQNFNVHSGVDTDDSERPYLDSVVLHSPLGTMDETMEAWRTLESFVPVSIHSLGISNVTLSVLQTLYDHATIKPAVVQNRFHAATKFEVDLRRYCKDNNIVFQSFWTLSANPKLLQSQPVLNVRAYLDITAAAALYCLVLGLENVVILNGTTDPAHMREDLEAIDKAKQLMSSDPKKWEHELGEFRSLIQES